MSNCTGRFAQSWEFAGFWCVGGILSGVDDSGGAANADLTCSLMNFSTLGVTPHVGMILYNTTQGTSGAVTAVTTNTITATGVTWDDADGFRIALIDAAERSTIEHYLNVSATDIHAALAAVGACDCALADWAADYLAKLNIVEAASYYQCTCGQPSMSEEARNGLLAWCTQQLTLLMTGRIDVCDGATGSDFPAIGWAEQSGTDFAAARIIYNRMLREG